MELVQRKGNKKGEKRELRELKEIKEFGKAVSIGIRRSMGQAIYWQA
jgi:hypothetical protein